ncbi:mucin-5AC-like [Sycon ciliatum]|uniref:mucin-5AC-like n=1 Tax=Sycon ciliatum TaxID=27933 RepID=UPI0031F657A7
MEWRRNAISVNTGFRACWLMAVYMYILLEIEVVKGQVVSLSAAGTGQTTTAFTVTFGDGQPTADVTSYLPVCIVGSGSGPFIRLEKTDGSLVLAETGAFTVFGRAPVNSTEHPILDTSYTGLYHCRTVDRNSSQTYQLNIVAQQVQSGISPTSLTLPYSGVSYTIPCRSSGNFPLNASWSLTLSLDSQKIKTVTYTNMVDSMVSFRRNDSQIVFTESDTSGVTFNVICTTLYTTNFDCIGLGSTPSRPQSVIDRCVNAAQAISTTVSVTIQAKCPTINDSKFNYKPVASFNTLPGTTVSIECITGFLSNKSMEITQSTCQGNGRWQPSQPLCERCIVECNDTNVVDCNHVVGMAAVNCICGQNLQWTMGKCQPTHCPELNSTTVMNIPRSTTGSGITVSCTLGFDTISMPSSVTCQADGTWTTLPICQVIPMDPATTTVNSTPGLTTGSTRESCTTTSAENQTQTSYTLGTVIGGVVGGMFFGMIAMMVVAIIVHRKIQGKPVKTEDPGQTQNAAYEDADIAESSLTKSDAYGVLESAPQPQYEFVCP